MACLMCDAPRAKTRSIFGAEAQLCAPCFKQCDAAKGVARQLLVGALRGKLRASAPMAFDVFSSAFQAYQQYTQEKP